MEIVGISARGKSDKLVWYIVIRSENSKATFETYSIMIIYSKRRMHWAWKTISQSLQLKKISFHSLSITTINEPLKELTIALIFYFTKLFWQNIVNCLNDILTLLFNYIIVPIQFYSVIRIIRSIIYIAHKKFKKSYNKFKAKRF